MYLGIIILKLGFINITSSILSFSNVTPIATASLVVTVDNLLFSNSILTFCDGSSNFVTISFVSFKTAISEFLATTFNEDFKFVNSLISSML